MLLRSSEIKPLFIDLSPTQQCLKHSLPALFVPPSPLHINPPIANRVRPAMATFPLPWLHHRCCSSLRRALGPAAPSLSISFLFSLSSLFSHHRATPRVSTTRIALPAFQPFSLSHLSLFSSSLFSFALLGGFGCRRCKHPRSTLHTLCPFALYLPSLHDATLPLSLALCADSCRKTLCIFRHHTRPSATVTPSRQPRNLAIQLAISQLHQSRLFRICALALQFAWPLPSRSHFASPH